ncbi:MAG: hypothetical protein H6982_06255 [Chromatiales bacterium]|nr:hypothetical protein [Chromatiales bacterium]
MHLNKAVSFVPLVGGIAWISLCIKNPRCGAGHFAAAYTLPLIGLLGVGLGLAVKAVGLPVGEAIAGIAMLLVACEAVIWPMRIVHTLQFRPWHLQMRHGMAAMR